MVSSLADAEDVSELVTALRFKRVIVTGLDCTRRLGATVAAALCGARLAHVTEGPRADDPLETLTPAMLARLCWTRPSAAAGCRRCCRDCRCQRPAPIPP